MKIYVLGGKISDEEKEAYTKTIQEKYPDREIESITITVDGDYVDCKTHFVPDRPFDRIRRITGYLVGTLDRFNDGKRAEERDRVKHDVPMTSVHAGDL
jgi:anaerobic ribonucleoside-triphosphate reductase